MSLATKQAALVQLRAELKRLSPESEVILEFAPRGYEAIKNGSVLLIKIGEQDGAPIVWRLPYEYKDWALFLLPVYAKRLKPVELHEAKILRLLKLKMKRERWHLLPDDFEHLERLIADAEAVLARARIRPVMSRYAVAKTVDGKEKQIHKLYLAMKYGMAEEDVTECGAWTDFLDYTNIHVHVSVVRNVGLLPAQKKSKALPEADDGKAISNLYLKALYGTAAAEQQAAFNRSMQQPSEGEEGASISIKPNADLGVRCGTPKGVMDCGKVRPLTPGEGPCNPERHSPGWKRVALEWDRLFPST